LVLPDLRLFLAFEAADIAVFVTEFSWLGRYTGFGGLPLGAVEIAALVRAIVLIGILVGYIRHPTPPLGAAASDVEAATVAEGSPEPPH
jgi:hypothetical protein